MLVSWGESQDFPEQVSLACTRPSYDKALRTMRAKHPIDSAFQFFALIGLWHRPILSVWRVARPNHFASLRTPEDALPEPVLLGWGIPKLLTLKEARYLKCRAVSGSCANS